MQVELTRCIDTAKKALADLSLFAPTTSPCTVDAHAASLLHAIAASSVPKIEDSRVPAATNTKLHNITQEYFRRACMSLLETHAPPDVASLQSTALQLKSTFTHLYERQVIAVATALRKTAPKEKQPYANDVLLYAYEQSQHPTRRERERLAGLTGMTVEQVRVWFQNRRSRLKKKASDVLNRPALQLHDLLERVVSCNKMARSSASLVSQDEFEDECNSGYCSVRDTSLPNRANHLEVRPERASLFITPPTARSYPAVYLPQPLTARFACDPPVWAQRPAACPPTYTTTVTLDELARCMARLTLRHRRPSPCPSSGPSLQTLAPASEVSMQSPDAPKKPKAIRKDPATQRRIAGGRRSLSVVADALPLTLTTTASPASDSISASGAATKGRKKPGPARRKPAGKALSRQPSDASMASSSSSTSDSSRSTSYASDYSFVSRASDCSLTSVESDTLSMGDTLLSTQKTACLGANVPFAVPVYDFSAAPFDLATAVAPTSGATDMFNNLEMMELLETVQAQQCPQYPVVSPGGSAPGQHPFDVGLGDMDVLLDFSAAPFPNLDALLSDETSAYCAMPVLQHQRSLECRDLCLLVT